jgi:hypothetical protein
MGAAKNVVLEPLAYAAVLHNVIIVHPYYLLGARSFFMHYNATLCNTALGKFLLTISVFLFSLQNVFGHTKTFLGVPTEM